MRALALAKKQQDDIANRACFEYHEKTGKDIDEIILHVLNIMKDQYLLKDVEETVKHIGEMIGRKELLETEQKKIIDKEYAKQNKKPRRKKSNVVSLSTTRADAKGTNRISKPAKGKKA